jgi:hypothetical protein
MPQAIPKQHKPKALDAGRGDGLSRAQKSIEGRRMVQSGEMLAEEGAPLPIEQAKRHRKLCVGDPWTKGLAYVLDREAPWSTAAASCLN